MVSLGKEINGKLFICPQYSLSLEYIAAAKVSSLIKLGRVIQIIIGKQEIESHSENEAMQRDICWSLFVCACVHTCMHIQYLYLIGVYRVHYIGLPRMFSL